MPPRNFIDRLQQLAGSRPHDTALIVVDAESVERVISYGALEQRVRGVAEQLERQMAPGERALLLLDNDEHYAIGLLACFYAGVIAVPAFPPETMRSQHLARLRGIAADAQPRIILAHSSMRSRITEAGLIANAALLEVDEQDASSASSWRPHLPSDEDIAFLQYTSGSTSAPKGVRVSHGNLMANERAIAEAMQIRPEDKFGVWSPLFHDMGLVGGLLQPLHAGIPCVLTTPRYFLERPLRWLELISRHRVTISGGPDFAYRLCLDRVRAIPETLDLSSWRVAYTGAEPVRHDTMQAFISRYARFGLRASAVYPCYGLAEATLYLTGMHGIEANAFCAERLADGRAVNALEGTTLVSCGRIASGHEIRIVSEAGDEVAEGCIGEIWASGPSIAHGYWNKPRESAETFPERDGRRFLRTGDLGFLREGALYVTGRIKDMIIVRGHNLYPQDLERAVEAQVEAVREGRVAAFSVEIDGCEGIGIAAEISRGRRRHITPETLADAIGTAVSELCGEAPKVTLLLNPGALPKTSSGKLQRSACRRGWMERSLDCYALFEHGSVPGGTEAAGHPLSDEIEHALAEIWREVLDHGRDRRYGRDAHFFGRGGTSLSAVQLALRVAERWKLTFEPSAIFEWPRLRDQAAEVRRLQARAASYSERSVPILTAERRAQPIPLSHAQRRQWFLWKLDPFGTAYHVQAAVRLTGVLDVTRLRAAIASLAERHESLRTLFTMQADGEPAQLVQQRATWALESIDLRDGAPSEREALALERMRALNAQPFDLERGPLVRALVMQLAEDEHLLALVTHHIVCDGVSMQLLFEELAARYAARHVPAAPPIQYADYAAWQCDTVDEAARERQLAYWRSALDAGAEHPVLQLTTDRPRKPGARLRAAHCCFQIPRNLVIDLRAAARKSEATLSMALLAGFQALLYRYSGEPDIRIGVPVAARLLPQAQPVVGLFVNTVLMRNVIEPRMSLTRLLERARADALGAQAHQEVPFERLVDDLAPNRSTSHNPLFQVMFNHLQHDLGSFSRLTDLDAREQWLPDLEAQFELALDVREEPDDCVRAWFTYADELFDASRIERLVEHYVLMLRAMVEAPTRAVGDVTLLNAEELKRLDAWSVSERQSTYKAPVHQLIAQQAAERPSAVALILGNETLTYGALDRRANRLAHQLLRNGVVPEARVGIMVERSIDMVTALLAILKAGAVFAPLDPDYPGARLAHMIEDAGIEVLLTQCHLHSRIPEAAARVLDLDTLDLLGEPKCAPVIEVHEESLAYVIYTSGSSGKPKGVAVTHRALSEHTEISAAFSSLTPRDRMLQFATLSFDGFIEQLFPPLITGAAVVLRGPALWSIDELERALIEQQITVVDLPTAYWFAWIRARARTGNRSVGQLREVHIGGEEMPVEGVTAWIDAGLGGVKLLNTYGPTEAVVVASLFDCAPLISGERSVNLHMPIGRPLQGRSLRVVDAALDPVPPGVEGELCIGGALLARGYLNRAALTAERFVADPFDSSGGRLYRTGDRARWNPHGELEYLGRNDQQLKIRGFRIELKEIESQLLACPQVREAVVLVQESAAGPQLIAYVSPAHRASLDASELRSQLALPHYMIPAAIMVLDHLPLTANGKVDRSALAQLATRSEEVHEAPQGELEERIAALWSELLRAERIGRRESFFDLGGHSLLLLEMQQRLQERFGVNTVIAELFRYPTVELLAAFLAGTEARSDDGAAAARAARQRSAFRSRRPEPERVES